MKILVIGCYYSLNLGDAVICDCVAALLRRQYPSARVEIRDISGNQAFPQRRPLSYEQLLRGKGRHMLRTCVSHVGWNWPLHHAQREADYRRESLLRLGNEECDLVVFAGGQLFMDTFALFIEILVTAFRERNIPVFFNACGVGPSCSPAIRQRLASALWLDHVRYVSCRDDVALLNSWCGGARAVSVSDPALYTREVYGVEKDPDARTVGLGIMFADTMPLAASRRFWHRLIRDLEKRGIPWKIFTNGSQMDMTFAREILRSMPELTGEESQYLCPPPADPAELVKLIASFGSLISYRLHSHIIATSLDIPTVAIQWDRKLPLFFAKIGCPERCLTAHATPKQVLAALEQAKAQGYDRDSLRAQQEHSARSLYEAMDPYLTDRGTL